MSSSSQSLTYFIQSCKILESYSLSSMIENISVETLDQMICEHQLILRTIHNFDDALSFANKIISNMTGFNVNIRSFISSERDLRALYDVLIAWRDSVLPRNSI